VRERNEKAKAKDATINQNKTKSNTVVYKTSNLVVN
jgi:hypothetical protein